MIKEKLGARIKEIRIDKAHLNQDELARKIGVNRTYVSHVECGKQNTSKA